jgi:hypothetical protein
VLKLSEAQMVYLNDLLAGFDYVGITGEEWSDLCREVIRNSRVFSDYDAHGIFAIWLSGQVRH